MLMLPNMGKAKAGRTYGQRHVPAADVPRRIQEAHEKLLAEGEYPGVKAIAARVRVGIVEVSRTRKHLAEAGVITVPPRPDRRGQVPSIDPADLPGRVLAIARDLIDQGRYPSLYAIKARLRVSNTALGAARNALIASGQLPDLPRNHFRRPRGQGPITPRRPRRDRPSKARAPRKQTATLDDGTVMTLGEVPDPIFDKDVPFTPRQLVTRLVEAERRILGRFEGF